MMAIKIGMKAVRFAGRSLRYRRRQSAGRTALSNLLNGKASLSLELALRVEKAVGVKMDTLLAMQTRYDAYHTSGH